MQQFAQNTDNSPRLPVSIKGVVFLDGKVILLRNERDEWELPGGKLERGETPESCVIREINEELSLSCTAEQILDCWLYNIRNQVEVLIVTYGCIPTIIGKPALSHEHKELGLFSLPDMERLPMPEGYRRSIRHWAKVCGFD